MPRAKKQPITSTVREIVDGEAVCWLLLNEAFAKAVAKESDHMWGVEEEHRQCVMGALRHYKAQMYSVNTAYKHGRQRTDGREYAIGPCLQRCQRLLRNLQTRGLLRDWDLVNAFAALLFCWCVKNLRPEQYEQLTYYNENREAIFARLGPMTRDLRFPDEDRKLDRDGMKAAFTGIPMGGGTLINGGTTLRLYSKMEDQQGKGKTMKLADFSDPWVLSYYHEMQGIMDAIADAFPDDLKAVKGGAGKKKKGAGQQEFVYNAKGKCVSRVLGRMESEVLTVMREVAEGIDGVEVHALVFDGFMTGMRVPADFAARLTAAIKDKLDLDLQVIEKPIKRPDIVAAAAKFGVTLNNTAALEALLARQDAEVARIERGEFDDVPELVDDDDDDDGEEEEDPRGGGGVILHPDLSEIPVHGVCLRNGVFVLRTGKLLKNGDGMGMGKTEQLLYKILYMMSGGRVEEIIAEFNALEATIDARRAAGEFGPAAEGEVSEEEKNARLKARGELAAQWHEMGGGGSIVCITQRCTMVSALMSRLVKYGFKRYNSNKRDGTGYGGIFLYDCPYVIVEYESLHRVFGTPGMVVMDEFRSVINAMVSPTNGNEGSLVVAHMGQLRAMVEKEMCTDVLMLDADLECDGAVAAMVMHMQGWCLQHRLRVVNEERRVATEALVRAVQAGGEEQAVAAARAAMLAACEKEAALRAAPPDSVVDTTTGHKKIKRDVVIMKQYSAMDRIVASVGWGNRVAIMFGSKSDANAMAALLAQKFADKDIGLYTGETAKKCGIDAGKLREDDVNKLWANHDVIIFTSVYTTGADYQGAVDEVYVMPHTGVATPRDMMQGSGRLRNVSSNTVFLGVGEDHIRTCALKRGEIDARYTAELELMGRARGVRTARMAAARRDVVYNLEPAVAAEMVLKQTDDALLDAYAYSNAERHFARSWRGWVGWWRYMCELKEYKVTVDDTAPQMTRNRNGKLVPVMQEGKLEQQTALKECRVIMYGEVDVSAFVSDEGFKNLNGFANGGVGMTMAEMTAFMEEHPDICRDNLQCAIRKAQACRVLRHKDGDISSEQVDVALRHETAIHTHEVMEHVAAGVAAPALVDMMKRLSGEVPLEGLRAHPMERAVACTDVLEAIGVPYDRVVDAHGFWIPDGVMSSIDRNRRLTAVMERAAACGICKTVYENGDITGNWARLKDMFESNLGLVSPSGYRGFFQIKDDVLDLLVSLNRVTPVEWFREKHGATLVLDDTGKRINNFNPSESMTAATLDTLRRIYAENGHADIAARAEGYYLTNVEREARQRVEYREMLARREEERVRRVQEFQARRVAGDARRAAKRAMDKEQFQGLVKRARVAASENDGNAANAGARKEQLG